MRNLFGSLRRLVGKNDARTAYAAETGVLRAALDAPVVDPRLSEESARRLERRDPATVVLGTAAEDSRTQVTLPLADVPGATHVCVIGAAGAGKSRVLGGMCRGVVRGELAGEELGLVVLDPKSELSDLVIDLSATELMTASPEARARFMANFRLIDPFDESRPVVPLNILAPIPGVAPELQAFEVSTALGHVGGEGMGPNQTSFVYTCVLAAIGRATLPELYEIMGDPVRLATFGAASTSSEARSFFAGRRIASQSLEGVRSRIHSLLRVPAARRCLETPTCQDFSELLGNGVSILATGNPPLGCEDIAKSFSLLFAGRLGRAVFARRNNSDVPCLMVCDEFQETVAAGAYAGETFLRLLNLARSRRIAMVLATQTMANVGRTNAALPEITLTNAGVLLGFRSSVNDARIFEGGLRTTGRRTRPASLPWEEAPRSPYLTAEEERRVLLTEAAALEPRSFYCWDKRRPFGAVLVHAASVEPDRAAGRMREELLGARVGGRGRARALPPAGGVRVKGGDPRAVGPSASGSPGGFRVVARRGAEPASASPAPAVPAVPVRTTEEPPPRGRRRPRRRGS